MNVHGENEYIHIWMYIRHSPCTWRQSPRRTNEQLHACMNVHGLSPCTIRLPYKCEWTHCNTLQLINEFNLAMYMASGVSTFIYEWNRSHRVYSYTNVHVTFICGRVDTLQHTATHCNTLQHISTWRVAGSSSTYMHISGGKLGRLTSSHMNTHTRLPYACKCYNYTC